MYLETFFIDYYYGFGIWAVFRVHREPTRYHLVGDYVQDDFGNLTRVAL